MKLHEFLSAKLCILKAGEVDAGQIYLSAFLLGACLLQVQKIGKINKIEHSELQDVSKISHKT